MRSSIFDLQAVKEEEDNQEEEEDLDVVMLEANEAASAQKEILKKTTDYLLRHPIFLSEQLKRHDLQVSIQAKERHANGAL